MFPRAVAAAAVLAIVLHANAQADPRSTFTPAAHSSFDLDLNSEAGHYSHWESSDLSEINALRASATVRRLGDDPRWAPAFNFAVVSDSDEYMVQIVSADRATLTGATIKHLVSGRVVDTQNWGFVAAMNQALEVRIDWTASGLVSFSAGGREAPPMQLAGPVKTIEINSSTGELNLRDVRLGATAP